MLKIDMPKSRNSLSSGERALRSELRKILNDADAFIHGSLTLKKRTCGKPNCKCASDPDARHASTSLGRTRDRKTSNVHIPAHLIDTVSEWADNHRRVAEILRQLDDIARERLAELKAKPPPDP